MARMVTSAADILAAFPVKPERVVGPARSEVREWAIRYGFTDTETGRLSAEVVAMYRALHQDGGQ